MEKDKEKEQFISEGNRLIAEFMGYIYYHKGVDIDFSDCGGIYDRKEIFSKVPIEVAEYPDDDQYYFKDVPNPNYGKVGVGIDSREKVNWEGLNWGNFIYDLKYHEDWNSLMEVIAKIHDLEEEYPVVKNNFHITIGKRFVRFIYDYDGWCLDREKITDESFKRFQESSKDYRYIIFDDSPIYATWCGVIEFIKWFKEKEKENGK